MSRIALDEARMIMENQKKKSPSELSEAYVWASIGLLEAQQQANIFLQAQNELLTGIANRLERVR